MRAARVVEFGPPSSLSLEEIPDLVPGPGEVIVEVAAASVNFPDILVVNGSYQHLPARPFTPGKDAAGRVRAVGPGVDRVAVGQRVLALVEYGGWAEQLRVDMDSVVEIPEGVAYEDAAALGLVYSTAHLALHRCGRLAATDTVLVTGAGGGVGSAGVQLAKIAGARVIALAKDTARADLARAHGADIVLTSAPGTLRDDLLTATDGRGVDLVLDVLGGDYLTQIVRATAWEGRIVVTGFASGGQNPIKPGHILVKNISVVGMQSSDYRDRMPALTRQGLSEALQLVADGRIDPAVDSLYPLDEIASALQRVQAGGVRGKVVVTTGVHSKARTALVRRRELR